MPDRVVVFIDYQNAYHGARRAFLETAGPHPMGQINPLLLGQYLVAGSRFDRQLMQVRVYRGHPDADLDPKGYAAARRQVHAWTASPMVKVTTRPLKYPRGWPDRCLPGERPQEKGIDVALSVDFTLMAEREKYDVGILFSTDTDMKYALEVVAADTSARPEVAAWFGPQHSRLEIEGRNLWCHWIREPTYRQIEDPRDYTK